MRIQICVAVQIIAVGFLQAQNTRIDSLKNLLASASSPTQKIELLNRLTSESWDYDFEKSLGFAKEAYALSKELDWMRGKAYSLTSMGLYHFFKGNYPEALMYYRQALKVANGKIDGDIPAFTFIRMGSLYRASGKTDSAKWYFLQAIESLKDQQEGYSLSSAYQELAVMYFTQAEYDSAIKNLNRSLAIRTRQNDPLMMAECWKTLGMVYKSVSELDQATGYYEKTLQVAVRQNDPELLMYCNISLGELDYLRGNYVGAIGRYSKALDILKTHDYKVYRAVVLQLMGRLFDSEGNYPLAVDYFIASLKIDEELGNMPAAARTKAMLAIVFGRQRNDSVSLKYARESLSTNETLNDKEGIAMASSALGFIYFQELSYDKSLAQYKRSLGLYEQLKMQLSAAEIQGFLAEIYEVQGSLTAADQHLSQAIQIYERIGNKSGMIAALNGLGSLAMKRGDFVTARSKLNSAEQLAKQIGSSLLLRNNYQLMAELFRATGKLAEAIEYYKKTEALNNEIFSGASIQKSALLSSLFQLDKKEKEIELLNAQNIINQNQMSLQQQKIRWQNGLLWGSILGIIFLITLAAILYLYYRQKAFTARQLAHLNKNIQNEKDMVQAQAKQLQEMNEELVKSNREIIEQKEEILAQSEELTEASETIKMVNHDLEATVEDRTRKLKEAYHELDTFFYRASHDFRRPLTTFLGLAEVAKITVKDQTALDLFDKVKQTARDLDQMLNKLRSISEVGSSESVYREVYFKDELGHLYDSYKDEFNALKIDFRPQVKVTKPFLSYPAIIRIILNNLVENAIRFTNPLNAYIEMHIYERERDLVMQVTDNGIGIRSEYQQRVFDMFFRASERSKGNGLGLYIVKKSVDKLGGEIKLVSAETQGTSISVFLPLRELSLGS